MRLKNRVMVVSFALVFGAAGSCPVHAQTVSTSSTSGSIFRAADPGVRAGSVNAGKSLSTLSPSQSQYFEEGQAVFSEVEGVEQGLGPTYNATSCAGCHAQPAVGGTSPATNQFPNLGPNPQIEAATNGGATNKIPFFIAADGPVREARFPFKVASNGVVTRTPDGGVHALYTITGRSDANTCSMTQPNF